MKQKNGKTITLQGLALGERKVGATVQLASGSYYVAEIAHGVAKLLPVR